MSDSWSTVAAAAVGAAAGISGGTVLEIYKRRRDRRITAYALAAAIGASIKEVVQFKVVESLKAMVIKMEEELDAPFTSGKMFQNPPVKYNIAVFEKHIDRVGLIHVNLAQRTILWFSAYAGFQHTLWTMLAKCETNKQAVTMLKLLDEAWKDVSAEGLRLADDLVRSARWYR